MGGSGSGKSTVLRTIGRLQRVDRGAVLIRGEDVAQVPEWRLRSFRRRIGMMFQGGALLDSMTVYDNVALPLAEQRRPAHEIADRVSKLLQEVELPDAGPLMPAQLSGGMVKRAALARALVSEPEILLCDEPFSGLDPVNVRRIEALLVDLARRRGVTMIIASHHIPSSRRMARQIAFLQDGQAVVAPPAELEASTDRRIADFFLADGDGPFDLEHGAAA
jgi:phospholipid/cholesterol/gamma-HCH transport system ATP-binding protein